MNSLLQSFIESMNNCIEQLIDFITIVQLLATAIPTLLKLAINSSTCKCSVPTITCPMMPHVYLFTLPSNIYSLDLSYLSSPLHSTSAPDTWFHKWDLQKF
jgi:hypothetical protein